MVKLSDIPHEMLTQALADLEQFETNPHYSIVMRSWHEDSGDTCRVCLAGCVMGSRYGIPPRVEISPHYEIYCDGEELKPVPWDVFGRGKLLALDYFRRGSISGGLYELEEAAPKELSDRFQAMQSKSRELGYEKVDVTDYTLNPAQFKQDMFLLVGYLQLLWTKTA